jgi:hypothetical protein
VSTSQKISELTAVTSLVGTEKFPVVQGSNTRSALVSDVRSYMLGQENTFTERCVWNGNGNDEIEIEVYREDGVVQANITATGYNLDGGGTFHGRHARGTRLSPTPSQAGDITGGIGSRACHTNGTFHSSSPASIHWQVTENQSSTGYGMWLRFLTTPKTSTTRHERGGITDNGTLWIHGTGTYDATADAQTLPHADARAVVSAQSAAPESSTGASFAAVAYGTGVTAGLRGMHARGTPASRTATQSGDMLGFLAGHGFTGSAWTSAANALVAAYAQENFTGSANGARVSVETTPNGSATRAEAARFDGNATAGETRFMLYDVDNGTLERVSVGAADSGGVGYKVLRIPN